MARMTPQQIDAILKKMVASPSDKIAIRTQALKGDPHMLFALFGVAKRRGVAVELMEAN